MDMDQILLMWWSHRRLFKESQDKNQSSLSQILCNLHFRTPCIYGYGCNCLPCLFAFNDLILAASMQPIFCFVYPVIAICFISFLNPQSWIHFTFHFIMYYDSIPLVIVNKSWTRTWKQLLMDRSILKFKNLEKNSTLSP